MGDGFSGVWMRWSGEGGMMGLSVCRSAGRSG